MRTGAETSVPNQRVLHICCTIFVRAICHLYYISLISLIFLNLTVFFLKENTILKLKYLVCDCDRISLVVNDVGHIFMCLLAICTFFDIFLNKYLYRSYAHFNWIVFIIEF